MRDEIERFLERLRHVRRRSDHTIRAYCGDLRILADHIEGAMGRPPQPVDFTRPHLRACLAEMAETCAPSTRTRRIHCWRTFGRHLQRRGLLARNPAAGLQLPKRPTRVKPVLTLEQIVALVATFPGSDPFSLRNTAALELLFASGVRVAELAGLNVADVNLDDRELFVEGGKGDADRIVLFGRPAESALRRYLEAGRPALRHPVTGRRDPSALFLSRHGARITTRSVARMVAEAGRRIGVDGLGPHDLRRAFVTAFLDAGADLTVAKTLAGHADLSVTARYDACSLTRLRRAYGASHPHATLEEKPETV